MCPCGSAGRRRARVIELSPCGMVEPVLVEHHLHGRFRVEGHFFAAVPPRLRGFGAGGRTESGARDVGPVSPGQSRKALESVGGDGVVGVEEEQPVAACSVDSGVAGIGKPAVGLVDHAYARVAGGRAVADSGRGVGGAVIDDHHLPVPGGLPDHGVHAGLQESFGVVGRYYHRNHFLSILRYSAGSRSMRRASAMAVSPLSCWAARPRS